MSYDIHLEDENGKVIEFAEKHDIRGGTYALGGTTRAELNITYNYACYFYEKIDAEHGIRALYGMKARVAAPMLLSAIQQLGIARSSDYWESTPGNAGAALYDLLTLCLMAPEGIIRGD